MRRQAKQRVYGGGSGKADKPALQVKLEAFFGWLSREIQILILTLTKDPVFLTPEMFELRYMRKGLRNEVYEKFFEETKSACKAKAASGHRERKR